MTDWSVRLRPFREADLEMLYRDVTDPDYSLPFQWYGFRSTASIRRRWEKDNFLEDDPRQLVVADLRDDEPLGFVAWSNYEMFGRAAAPTLTIGIMLSPEHRGRGVGTAAQRLLADHLFATTQVHRLVANTEFDNIAEQRALEKSGFVREGVMRQVGLRDGQWRDAVHYARLRSDPPPG